MPKRKILLDTDIGSDIDDAVALAYLLAEPECELLGITTVTGEAEKRAMMASALCRVAGADIPIYPGAERPIFVPQKQPEAPQAAALPKWGHDTGFPEGGAVEFLRATIREHPGEVTLLSIGPLTNIGLLYAVDPEIPSLLARHVMMGGAFLPNGAAGGKVGGEWNCICDPHATAAVFGRGRNIRAVGLDVTRKVQMDADQVKQRFTADLLKPVLDFAEYWFKRRDRITFHDPLAAVTVFHDDVCAFRKGMVEVEMESGVTCWNPQAGDPRHEIAVEVNPDLFFDRYFGVF